MDSDPLMWQASGLELPKPWAEALARRARGLRGGRKGYKRQLALVMVEWVFTQTDVQLRELCRDVQDRCDKDPLALALKFSAPDAAAAAVVAPRSAPASRRRRRKVR